MQKNVPSIHESYWFYKKNSQQFCPFIKKFTKVGKSKLYWSISVSSLYILIGDLKKLNLMKCSQNLLKSLWLVYEGIV